MPLARDDAHRGQAPVASLKSRRPPSRSSQSFFGEPHPQALVPTIVLSFCGQ